MNLPADENNRAECISVVLPVYNAAPYLDAAIASILGQSHRNLELLAAVDGGSTDASGSIVEAWASHDARVRPIPTPHITPTAARLLAAGQARGSHIAFMDADDISLPHRLEAQLAYMRRHDLAICGCLVEEFTPTHRRLLWFPRSHEAIAREQLFRFGLFTPALMMRTGILAGLDRTDQRIFEDHAWWNERIRTEHVGNVPEVLYRWRGHDTNLSKRHSQEVFAEWRRGREQCFFRFFPDATREDFDAFDAAAVNRPQGSVEALDRAGKWLAALAGIDELPYRERLALRWRRVCMESAGIGPQAFRIYCKYRTQFGAPPPGGMRVRLLSLMRLSSGSTLYRNAARVARYLRRSANRSEPASP
ncbi:MAG: glycosyltransferase family 2 protein [Rhizomicrobium sp.]